MNDRKSNEQSPLKNQYTWINRNVHEPMGCAATLNHSVQTLNTATISSFEMIKAESPRPVLSGCYLYQIPLPSLRMEIDFTIPKSRKKISREGKTSVFPL